MAEMILLNSREVELSELTRSQVIDYAESPC